MNFQVKISEKTHWIGANDRRKHLFENNLPLPPAVDADLFKAGESVTSKLVQMPDSLEKAIALAENSAFVKSVIGEELLLKYIAYKKTEADDFAFVENKTEFYRERYFCAI